MNSTTNNSKSASSQSQDQKGNQPQFDWLTLQDSLSFYIDNHLCCIPVPWRQKAFDFYHAGNQGWEAFKENRPTKWQIDQWFNKDTPTNIAIICGGVSNGLVALCFNDPNGAELFFGKELWGKLLQGNLVVQTSRGHHVYIRSSTKIKSQDKTKDGQSCWLEIRSDGRYIIAPPSLHPSGILYTNVGAKAIYKSKDLPGFLAKRCKELGLKDFEAERDATTKEKPKEKAKKEQTEEADELAIEELLEGCAFIKHCKDDAATLPEKEWWSMIHILVTFGLPGIYKIHELSSPYSTYTKEETDNKIREAIKAIKMGLSPHTCEQVQETDFICPEDCLARKWKNIKSPVVLARILAKRRRYGNLPTIIVTNKYLKENTDQTIEAIQGANNPPKIFVRSGKIVRIVTDEKGAPHIEDMNESACRGFVERTANFMKARTDSKGETNYSPLQAPPAEIVQDIMTLPEKNLPPLIGLSEVPILRINGSIMDTPGYDAISHLYYSPTKGLTIPPIPDSPSQVEVNAAIEVIKEPFKDFPYDSISSKTNAMAALFTICCRPIIEGLIPMCLFDKPERGTGASLQAEVISIIITGRGMAGTSIPRDEDEWRKTLNSLLRRGSNIIAFDNVKGMLHSATLEMVLTTGTILDRTLGTPDATPLANLATFIATGNNIRIGEGLLRRCYHSRMDALCARPWERDPTNFDHPLLTQWVKEERGRLLGAVFTIIRGWIVANKPEPEKLPILGGYQGWISVIGSIMDYSGFKEFLANSAAFYGEADVEGQEWGAFLEKWYELFSSNSKTTSAIITKLNEVTSAEKDAPLTEEALAFRATLPGFLNDRLNKKEGNFATSLGQNLSRNIDRRFSNGFMLMRGDKTRTNAVTWRVVIVKEGVPYTQSEMDTQ